MFTVNGFSLVYSVAVASYNYRVNTVAQTEVASTVLLVSSRALRELLGEKSREWSVEAGGAALG